MDDSGTGDLITLPSLTEKKYIGDLRVGDLRKQYWWHFQYPAFTDSLLPQLSTHPPDYRVTTTGCSFQSHNRRKLQLPSETPILRGTQK